MPETEEASSRAESEGQAAGGIGHDRAGAREEQDWKSQEGASSRHGIDGSRGEGGAEKSKDFPNGHGQTRQGGSALETAECASVSVNGQAGEGRAMGIYFLVFTGFTRSGNSSRHKPQVLPRQPRAGQCSRP